MPHRFAFCKDLDILYTTTEKLKDLTGYLKRLTSARCLFLAVIQQVEIHIRGPSQLLHMPESIEPPPLLESESFSVLLESDSGVGPGRIHIRRTYEPRVVQEIRYTRSL